MKAEELCRDALARLYPDRTIMVACTASFNCGRSSTEFRVAILPGFNFEECQTFTGASLSECLRKIETLTRPITQPCQPQPSP